MKIEIKTDKRKRHIGDLDYENHLFSKKVSKSKHLFRKLDAFAIDARYFRNILLPSNYDIKITETEDNIIYKTTAEKWSKHGEHYHFKQRYDDEDHKVQTFLSRRYFEQFVIGDSNVIV